MQYDRMIPNDDRRDEEGNSFDSWLQGLNQVPLEWKLDVLVWCQHPQSCKYDDG